MIHLSSSAIDEIVRLRTRRKHPDSLFRLSVRSGGCLDLYYALEFVESEHDSDQVCDFNGIRIVVDCQSIPYLSGLTLDYSEDLMGGGFRFQNPNAVQSCSCGSSFSTNE